MMEIKEELESVCKKGPGRIILSNKSKAEYECRRIEVRPMIQKGKEKYQITSYTKT